MKKTSRDLILELLCSDDSFPVEFERHWRLTGCRKETVKKELTESFKAGVNYCIRLQSLSHSKQQTARLWLTLNCFKALLQRTAKGQRIYQVFEDYERAFEKRVKLNSVLNKDVRIVNELKWQLLHKLCQDWSEPLAKINLAVRMLQLTDSHHSQYLKILQEECIREIKLLDQVSRLLEITSSENLQLLDQFNLLGNSIDRNNYPIY